MECNELKPQLHAYVDAELDAPQLRQIEEHLRACAVCTSFIDRARALKSATANPSLRFTAPADLKARLLQIAATAQAPAQATPDSTSANEPARLQSPFVTSSSPGSTPSSRRLFPHFLATAAACLICVGVTWLVAGFILSSSPDRRVAVAVVDSHIRSLMAEHLTDVISSDKHTVKPWFNGKTDFSPPVNDLSEQGYPLLGGRLEYLDGHAAAGLAYKRDKHIINLFVWPTSKPDRDIRFELHQNGYHVLSWIDHGMECWGISDLQSEHLMDWARIAKAAMDK